jgi:uncharacterized protein HemY
LELQQLSERSKVLFDTFSFKKKYERRRQHENEEDIYRRIGEGRHGQAERQRQRQYGAIYLPHFHVVFSVHTFS